MRKPVNRVAILLWIMAAFTIIGDVFVIPYLHHQLGQVIQNTPDPQVMRVYWFIATAWANIRSAVGVGGMLIASGMIVELLDRIRWEIAQRAKL